MLLRDLPAVTDLAKALTDIRASVASAQTVKILVNGKPIANDLLQQLHTVGDPVVAAYFSAQAASIIVKLNALGVTLS